MFKLQKRAIRIVANSKYNAHTEPLFKLFRILKLSDVLILQTIRVGVNSAPELDFLANSKSNSGIGI